MQSVQISIGEILLLSGTEIEYLENILNIVKINDKYHNKIILFLKNLLEQNSKLNLISRKMDVKTIILEHIYDSLSPYLCFKDFNNIVDLGTGGGFPGMLLAIVCEDIKFCLYEKSPKKCEYLTFTAEKLDLKNVKIVNMILSDKDNFQTDCITCRAFKPIDVVVKLTKNHFNSRKKYILYKGKKETIKRELFNIPNVENINTKIREYATLIEKERNMVILNKN